ncbi:hypothetical protein H0H92_005399 [Tricholoma furcatifolium]|nr:hypothetical protein H0H92_005399 [Tricholoma furcatifolium]
MSSNNGVMPPKNSSSAPRFDIADPSDLINFFDELEWLLEDRNVTEEEKMKHYAVRYAPSKVTSLWKTLPSYTSGKSSYKNWKNDVIALYPGANPKRKFTLPDLDRLTAQARNRGITNLADFATYYRTFYEVSEWLIKEEAIAQNERNRLFKKGFNNEFWTRIQRRLEICHPENPPDHPYTMEETKAAVEWILYGSDTTSIISGNSKPQAGIIPVAKTEQSVKLEALESKLDDVIKALGKSQSPGQQPNRKELSLVARAALREQVLQ